MNAGDPTPPMSFRLDKSYLEKVGRQFRVQMAVPARLRPIIGKAKLVVPLHTDSPALANLEKFKHVHALKQALAAAEVELRRRSKGTPADPLVRGYEVARGIR